MAVCLFRGWDRLRKHEAYVWGIRILTSVWVSTSQLTFIYQRITFVESNRWLGSDRQLQSLQNKGHKPADAAYHLYTYTPTHQLSPNQMPLPEGTHQVCFDPSSLNSLRALVLLYSQYECTNYRHSIGKLQGLHLFFPSMGVVRGEGGRNRLLSIIEATHSCLLLFQQVSLHSRHIPKLMLSTLLQSRDEIPRLPTWSYTVLCWSTVAWWE